MDDTVNIERWSDDIGEDTTVVLNIFFFDDKYRLCMEAYTVYVSDWWINKLWSHLFMTEFSKVKGKASTKWAESCVLWAAVQGI